MKLYVKRSNHLVNLTTGQFYIDNEFVCFTLEDEFRPLDEKVRGETRIPAGTYPVELRTEGTIHENYLKRFGEDFHKGTLHIKDIPGFKYVLIHIGNTERDTAGCILVGDQLIFNGNEQIKLGNSTVAYRRIYERIRDELLLNNLVWLEVENC